MERLYTSNLKNVFLINSFMLEIIEFQFGPRLRLIKGSSILQPFDTFLVARQIGKRAHPAKMHSRSSRMLANSLGCAESNVNENGSRLNLNVQLVLVARHFPPT